MLGLFNPWSHRRLRDLLSLYIDDRLDEAQVAKLEGHLATCVPCLEELQILRATVNLLQSLPQAVPARSFALTERLQLPRAAPAYLWSLRAATAFASVALVLLVAGDLLGTFSRDITSTGEAGQGAAERSDVDGRPPVIEEKAEATPQTRASEAAVPQRDSLALPDAVLVDVQPEVVAEAVAETEETVPVTALEVGFGSLLALLAIVTVLATWQFRRRRPLV